MWDNLIAEDPKLKKWFGEKYREGEAAGRIEGKAEGKAEAEAKAKASALAAMREAVLKTLKVRFPQLIGETWLAISMIDSYDTLSQIMAEFSVALDEDAARRALEAHIQQQ